MSSRFHPYSFLAMLLLVIGLIACNKKTEIKGSEFVERDVLVNMLVDIHLADGVSNDRNFHRKYDVDSIDILSPILDKYQVSKEMFDTTIVVYSREPELLDQVYSEVLIKLNVMLDENNKEDKAPNTPE